MLNTQLKYFTHFHVQANGQTKVINRSLGDLFRWHVCNYVTKWDLVHLIAEFAYNSSVIRRIEKNPSEYVMGIQLRKTINLVPLPLDARLNIEPKDFAKHMHDVHPKVRLL